jgi:hypothetical protein
MARYVEEAKAPLTLAQSRLKQVSDRLSTLKNLFPQSGEVPRFEMIKADLESKMDEAEMALYVKATTTELTAQEKKAKLAREAKAMEENRDKPSI